MGLPGSTKRLTDSSYICDIHEDRPATYQVQGETDSFGCEYLYMCDGCYTAYRDERYETWAEQACQRCGTKGVRPFRDYDEGMHGPVYYLCKKCISQSIQDQYE